MPEAIQDGAQGYVLLCFSSAVCGCDCRLMLVWVFRSFGGRNERHIHTTTWEHGKKHPQWLHHLHDQISPFLHFQVSAVQILGATAFCAMYHL
uniref:Uncharacterized protein n=1 Tax=Vitis vinifera TaxID=29760 RepID=F6HTC2_VITVI